MRRHVIETSGPISTWLCCIFPPCFNVVYLWTCINVFGRGDPQALADAEAWPADLEAQLPQGRDRASFYANMRRLGRDSWCFAVAVTVVCAPFILFWGLALMWGYGYISFYVALGILAAIALVMSRFAFLCCIKYVFRFWSQQGRVIVTANDRRPFCRAQVVIYVRPDVNAEIIVAQELPQMPVGLSAPQLSTQYKS